MTRHAGDRGVRDRRCKIGQLVIEKRAAYFERIRHRHAVHFHQHIAGQTFGRLEVQGLCERARAVGREAIAQGPPQKAGIGGQHPIGLQ